MIDLFSEHEQHLQTEKFERFQAGSAVSWAGSVGVERCWQQ